MEITRNTIGSAPGPSEWFTGAVYIDPVAAPSNGSRLARAGPLHAGRAHRVAHASARAIPATWGEHVGDEEYAAAPSLED